VITIGEIVRLSTRYLSERGSPSARLDAEILAATALGIRRLDLYLSPERPVADDERDRLREWVRRRGQSEPVAYITGVREFNGLAFEVGPAVLVPRPETEVVVDAAQAFLAELGDTPAMIVDVGTGSGAIAISIAVRFPSARVWATDVSAAALDVARRNATRHAVDGRITFVECDLLAGLPDGLAADLVVSNPPYIGEPEAATIDRTVLDFEPALALFAGQDGMSVTTRLVDQAATRLRPGGRLVVEVGSTEQRERVRRLLEAHPAFAGTKALADPAREVRAYMADRRED